jgi:hypothetical protein
MLFDFELYAVHLWALGSDTTDRTCARRLELMVACITTYIL